MPPMVLMVGNLDDREPESTRFLGREKELSTIDELFEQGHRVVTVLGPPGMGKTRLAWRYAEMVQRRCADGVCCCDLAGHQDVEALRAAVALALDIAVEPPAQSAPVSAALTARGAMLLVLDHVERLPPQAISALTVWLERTSVRMLVASRRRLQLREEAVLELPPLADGAKVFSARVRAVGGSFGAAGPAEIQRIVDLLDGIPLVLELVAESTRMLDVSQLLSWIEDGRSVLSWVGNRHASSCNVTLRAAIETSWELLDPEQREVLAGCSVFSGAFTVEAVEHVLGGDRPPHAPLVGVVRSLRDSSLLRASSVEDTGAPPTLTMYRCIRDFAAEKLALSGSRMLLERRRDAYFLRLASRVFASVASGSWGTVPAMVMGMRHQYKALLDSAFTALSQGRDAVVDGLRATIVLDATSCGKGLGPEQLAQLDALLAAADQESAPGIVGQALIVRAVNRGFGSADAEADCRRALALAEGHADRALAGLASSVLGWILLHLGRHDDAIECARGAQELHHELNDTALEIWDTAIEATALQAPEHGMLRQRRYEQMARLSRRYRFRHGEMLATAGLAFISLERGEFESARHCYDEAIELARSAGARSFAANLTGYLGLLHFDHDRLEDALALLTDAHRLARGAGDSWHEGHHGGTLGAVLAALDRIPDAITRFQEAEAILFEVPYWLAVLEVHRGHVDLARARARLAAGDVTGARHHQQHALDRLEVARSPGPLGRAPVERSDDLRVAARILERATQRLHLGPCAGSTHLVLAQDGSWLRVGREQIDLRRKAVLRRLLLALFQRRSVAPGKALSEKTLWEAGWLGERVEKRVAHNRFHVALNAIRSMGLREILQHTDDGYLLDPGVPVSFASPGGRASEEE